MKHLKQGDLVHLPSNVRLMKFSEDNDNTILIKEFFETIIPLKAVIVESFLKDQYVKVFYQGDYWYVKEKDIFVEGGLQ